MIETIRTWFGQYGFFLFAVSAMTHGFVPFVLAARRDDLLASRRRVPDVYFIRQNHFFRSSETKRKIRAGEDFFWRFNELGSDDLLFNACVIIWRLSRLLAGLFFIAIFIAVVFVH